MIFSPHKAVSVIKDVKIIIKIKKKINWKNICFDTVLTWTYDVRVVLLTAGDCRLYPITAKLNAIEVWDWLQRFVL